MMPCLINQQKN